MSFIIYLLLCAGVGYLAKFYGRSKIVWFCLSVFITPFLAFLILLIAGVPAGDEEAEQYVAEEVEHHIEEKENSLISEQDTECSHCNASVNLYTGKGVVVPDENAPWDIRCGACGNNLSV